MWKIYLFITSPDKTQIAAKYSAHACSVPNNQLVIYEQLYLQSDLISK